MPSAPAVAERPRWRAIQRVLLVEMSLNLLVAAAKAAVGLTTGSLAITSDAIHSTVDAGANLIALVAIRLSAAPPDPGHPYGHRKFEIVAATFVGFAVGAVAVRFAWGAVEALLARAPAPDTTTLGFGIILGTWAINIFIAVWERHQGRKLGSELLIADAAHTASDVLVTAAVLGSFTAAHFGIAWADPVGALIVVAFIARVAWGVIAPNLQILVDQAAIDPDRVRNICLAVEGAVGCHRIRSRGTERAIHLDLHLQVQADITVRAAHNIAHAVEDSLRKEIPEIIDVTVHVEPHDDAPEGL